MLENLPSHYNQKEGNKKMSSIIPKFMMGLRKIPPEDLMKYELRSMFLNIIGNVFLVILLLTSYRMFWFISLALFFNIFVLVFQFFQKLQDYDAHKLLLREDGKDGN